MTTQAHLDVREFLTREFMFRRPDLQLDDELDLLAEGLLDSIGIVRLTGFVEQNFDLTLEPVDVVAANFRTVSSMVRMVEAKTSVG